MRVLHLLVLVFLVCGSEYGYDFIEEQSQSLSFEDIVSSLSIQYVTFDDNQEDANVRSVEQKNINKQEEPQIQSAPMGGQGSMEFNFGKQVEKSQQIFAQVKEINEQQQAQPQVEENQEELKISSVHIDISQQAKNEVQVPIEQQQQQQQLQKQQQEQQQPSTEEQLNSSEQTNQEMLDDLDDEPQMEQESAENLLVVFNEAEYEEQQDNLSNVVLDLSGSDNQIEQQDDSIKIQTLIETEVEYQGDLVQDDVEQQENNSLTMELDNQLEPSQDVDVSAQQLLQESTKEQIQSDEQQNLIDVDSYNIDSEGIDNMTVHLESLQEQEIITQSFDEQTQSQLEQDSLYKEFQDLELAADEMQQEILIGTQEQFADEEQNLDTIQQDQEVIQADQQELEQESQPQQELIQEVDQQTNIEYDDQNNEQQQDIVQLDENQTLNENLYEDDSAQLDDTDLLGSDYILKIYQQFQEEDSTQHVFPKIDQQAYNEDIDQLAETINEDIKKESPQNTKEYKKPEQLEEDQELDFEAVNEDQTLIDYALFYDDPLPSELQTAQPDIKIPEQKHEPMVEMKLLSQQIDAELPDLYTLQEEKSLIDNLKQSQQKLREKISRVFDKKQDQLNNLEDATKQVEFIATNEEELKEQRKQQIYDQIKSNLEQKKQKLIEEPNAYKQDYPQEYEIEQAFFDWNMNKGIVLEGLPETTLVNLEQKVTTPIEQEELRTPIFEFVETKTTIQELDIQRQIDEFLGLDGDDKNYNLSDFDPLLDDFHSFLSVNQKLRVNLRKRKVLSV